MHANARKREPLQPPKMTRSNIRPGGGGEIKQTRKIIYRVGYTWNKGGRLKELRIRHLARKFLRKWMQKTFGRVHPNKARSHHQRVVLLQAFGVWRDEWWTVRRGWSLAVRADCHYRYHQCNWAFQSWQKFVCLQREKKRKLQKAQCVAARQCMRVVWDRWEVFLEMKRLKGRMRESALQHKRLATLCSAWTSWQTALQRHRDLRALEDEALQHWAVTLQSRMWLQWRETYTTACSQRENQTRASVHFTHGLQRKTLCGWMTYAHRRQAKEEPQAAAVRAWSLTLVRTCWSKWRSELHVKLCEKDRWQTAEDVARRSTQRRVLERWRTYVTLCHEEAEKTQMAGQHRHNQLLRAGLRWLSLNVTGSKTHRLNKHMAVQHDVQTTTKRYWRLWQHRLEEAEDKTLHPQLETALTHYSTALLSDCFHHWKEELVELRHIQGLRCRAETWFAERMLPRAFQAWAEFTLQRRLRREERENADVYNQRRQHAWVFYTWCERTEERREQRLSGRMAILHEERWCTRTAWARWRRRTREKTDDRDKRRRSESLYLHTLLQKTLSQWKDNSTEIRDRRNQEEQAGRHGDLHRLRWAMDGWQKFVEEQRARSSRQEMMDHYYQVTLLRRTLQAWKEHQRQSVEICERAEERYSLRQQHSLRRLLAVWRENTVFLAQARVKEQRAQSHYQHHLQTKVLLAWRQAMQHAVSKHHQQGDVVARAQSRIDQVRLRGTFLSWRRRTREAAEERRGTEKAGLHHRSTILRRALTAWDRHHDHHQKHEAMKRRGAWLFRLKTCQIYFERWKAELRRRRREAEQTELSLWHWSLSLQAKVLLAWRLWVTEKHRKQERLAGAVHFYREQLLREGVTHVLTHAAHMGSLGADLALRSQEQSSRRLQEVVQRCAMRWKQRTLCRPGREQEGGADARTPRKSVSFCLPTPDSNTEPRGTSRSEPAEEAAEDGVLSQLALTRASRLQPRCPKDLLDTPVKGPQQNSTQRQSVVTSTDVMTPPGGQQWVHTHPGPPPAGPTSARYQPRPPVKSCLRPPTGPSNPPGTLAVTRNPLAPPDVHKHPSDSHHEQQDVLLPPSSFMAPSAQPESIASCPGDSALLPPHQFTLLFNQTSYPGESLREADEESDPTAALTRELCSIREAMTRFQRDRKQLQAWHRLKEVLESWLQTSVMEEETERNSVRQEVEELQEHIRGLAAHVAKRKPAMLLDAARVQRLETLLRGPGAPTLRGPGAPPLRGPGAPPLSGPGAPPLSGPGALPLSRPGALPLREPPEKHTALT